jgi:hypothetical protein
MKKFIYGVKNLIKWFPTIWKDRDYDHYYTIEVLKKKLLFQARSMKKNSLHENSAKYVEQMETCAVLLHVIQNEMHIEEMMLKNYSSEVLLEKAIESHNASRKRLFAIMEENIEHWWY